MVKRTEQWYLKTKEEILKVAESLEVKRMPTYSELNLITGSSSLSRRIMKTGGFRHWSELLDLCDIAEHISLAIHHLNYAIAKMIAYNGFEEKQK